MNNGMNLFEFAYLRFAENFDVYDGDSIRADLDEGDYHWEIHRPLRLFGVDTPELNPKWNHYLTFDSNKQLRDREGREKEKKAAREARDRCKVLLEAATNVVLVQTIKLPKRKVRDKYGRTLAKILIPINDIWLDLSRALLLEKHARPYDGGRKTKWVFLRPIGQEDPTPEEVAAILLKT